MKEVLLTSSVLILALLVLREVFREKISRRVQYALWGLVLLRLLIPLNLPAVDFSVLSAVEPARVQVEQRLEENPVYVLPVERQEILFSPDVPAEPTVILPIEGRHVALTEKTGQPPVLTFYALSLEEALGLGWIVGMCGMGVWLAVSNLRFWAMLRKKRIPLELNCKYPVFLVEEGLVSPCLFGLVKPAVYLTPLALENEEGLRHVLAHEETHGRQGDPVWALLRSICLVVYWFDPLVWWASAAAKEDCELACDEGALKCLGENERIPYGQTLLRLIPLQRNRRSVLLTATTMTSDKKRMKERIVRIAENKKVKTAALCGVLAVVVCVCAVTFTGCAAEAGSTPNAPNLSDMTTTADEGSGLPAANLPADGAIVDGSVDMVIPLAAVSYGPMRVETQSVETLFNDSHHNEHSQHHGQQQHHIGGGCHTTGDCGTFAWSYDGNVYVSSHHLALSSFPSDYFLCMEDQNYSEEEFTGVFGYDGVLISYFGDAPDGYRTTINDFYIFDENGPSLLARVCGAYFFNDLDGDGTEELLGFSNWDCQLFYEQDGQICECNVKESVCENWPELDWKNTEYEIMPLQHCLSLTGPVFQDTLNDGTPGGQRLTATRLVGFDGENLTVSTPQRRMNDHMLNGIQDMSAVTDAARAMVKAQFETLVAEDPELWDDYCVTGLENVYLNDPTQLPGGIQVTVYRVSYEFHSPKPEEIDGRSYVYEDGWADGLCSYSDNPYLVFQIMDDGSYKQLENRIPSEVTPDLRVFDGEIMTTLMLNQLILPSEATGERLFLGLVESPDAFADALALYPDSEQDAALMKLLEYVDYLESSHEYKREYVSMIVEAMSDYPGNCANVARRLAKLMNN